METFVFSKTVQLADMDGLPITEGSVLRKVIKENCRGVVTWIGREGKARGPALSQYGDIAVSTGPGTTRVSNNYSEWQHIPHDEQTYKERFLSWSVNPRDYCTSENNPPDEIRAIIGIMHLLPSDVVNWEYGPYPDSLEEALHFLAEHLTELKSSQS